MFRKYDPNFLAASLDEAYLDVTEVCKEKGTTGEEVSITCHISYILLGFTFPFVMFGVKITLINFPLEDCQRNQRWCF